MRSRPNAATIEIRRKGKVHPVCLVVDAAGTLYATDDKGIDVLAPAPAEAR